MTTQDKLPPLADVFHREAQKRLVEGSRLQAKSSPDWPFEQAAAGCWQQAEVLAAPYDALIRQQEARIAELEKERETFRKGFLIANDQAEHVTSLFLPVEAERDQLARKVAELEACRDALNSANIEVGIEKERLRAELAPYRALAREAKVVLDGIDYGSMAGLTLERWVQRLAALHKEE